MTVDQNRSGREPSNAGRAPTRELDTGASDTGASGVEHLTVLGATVREPIEHVEVFPAPDHVTAVTLSTEELTSICPVTNQPDLASVTIEYQPDRWCIETKSLKLYLWGFRDRAVFAEALAAEIGEEVMATAQPRWVRVTLAQRMRGGIEVRAVASLDR